MSEADRRRFFESLRSALPRGRVGQSEPADLFAGRPAVPGAFETTDQVRRFRRRTEADRRRLLADMADEGRRIGAEVIPCETIDEARAALRRIVSETGPEWAAEKRVVCAKRPAVDRLHAAATLDVPVFVVNPETPADSRSPAGMKQQVIEKAAGAVAGVTEADFLIAGAAACVMRAHPDQPRALSLLPSVHIAVAGVDRLVADVDELYAILRHDPIERTAGVSRALTIVAGPSKTADIEATLVHGAHGPRRFVILVVNDFLT